MANIATFECSECTKKFDRKKSEAKGKNVFCGRECYLKSMVRRSSGERVKKKEYACTNCEDVFLKYESQMKDKKYTYCSRQCKNKHITVIFSGENHPRWNSELTEEQRITNRKYPEYLSWREAVYKRDSYTCQCCFDATGGNLVAHHILNYSEHEDSKTDVDNGTTLCNVCHKLFHDGYGYTKNSLAQLQDFLINYTPIPSQAAGKPAEGVETNEVA